MGYLESIIFTLFVLFMIPLVIARGRSVSAVRSPKVWSLLTEDLGFDEQEPTGSTSQTKRFNKQQEGKSVEVHFKAAANPYADPLPQGYSTAFRIDCAESGTDIAILLRRKHWLFRLLSPPDLEVFTIKELIGDGEPPLGEEDFRKKCEIVGIATQSFLETAESTEFQSIITTILRPGDVLEFGEQFILYEARGTVTKIARADEILKAIHRLQQLVGGPQRLPHSPTRIPIASTSNVTTHCW